MRGRKPGSIVTGDAPVALPRPPAWFGKGAKAEWRRVAPILMNERRTLDLADLAAFASYCLAVEQVAVASRALGTDYTYTSTTGLMKANPLVGIRDKAMAQVLRHAAELGMTSVSRSRATMLNDDADDSLVDF